MSFELQIQVQEHTWQKKELVLGSRGSLGHMVLGLVGSETYRFQARGYILSSSLGDNRKGLNFGETPGLAGMSAFF